MASPGQACGRPKKTLNNQTHETTPSLRPDHRPGSLRQKSRPLGSQRERYAHAANLQSYTGVAPVTKRSGGSCRIHRRYLCPKFHKQSFHEYAKESVLWCRWAAAYYLQQRTKGCSHHTSVRALAFKWQRIIWRCWQDRRPLRQPTLRSHFASQKQSPRKVVQPNRSRKKSLQKPGEQKLKNSLSDYLRGELSDRPTGRHDGRALQRMVRHRGSHASLSGLTSSPSELQTKPD